MISEWFPLHFRLSLNVDYVCLSLCFFSRLFLIISIHLSFFHSPWYLFQWQCLWEFPFWIGYISSYISQIISLLFFQWTKGTFVHVFVNLLKQCFFFEILFYFIKYIHDDTMSVANLYHFVLFGLFMSLKMKVDLICLQLFSFFMLFTEEGDDGCGARETTPIEGLRE